MRTIDTLLHRGELPLYTENTLKHKSQLNTRREVMFLNLCSAVILGDDHGEGILTKKSRSKVLLIYTVLPSFKTGLKTMTL